MHKKNNLDNITENLKNYCAIQERCQWEIIQKMLPPREVKSGYKAWTTKHIQKLLSFSKTPTITSIPTFPS